MVRGSVHTKPIKCKLFVEGGGDHQPALASECRKAFTKLLEKAGLTGRMPRIVVCGGRKEAYDQFCTAMTDAGQAGAAILLVDAEAPVGPAESTSPWDHVANRAGDGWKRPENASDKQLHLMVQCMEAWFLADRDATATFFGNGFHEKALPSSAVDIESIAKDKLYESLKKATRDTKTKGKYGKGSHSFKLLETLDPAALKKASPWAERFFVTLDQQL